MEMVMNIQPINLAKFRGDRSTVFTGRPQGEVARKELKLDDLDKVDEVIELVIPKGTTSFNSSFYLGLLYDSIKKLGERKFKERYILDIQDSNPDTRRSIERNLEDGMRQAINTSLGKSKGWLF
jgi:hypothetical protein